MVSTLIVSGLTVLVAIVGTSLDGISRKTVGTIKACVSGPNTLTSVSSGTGVTFYGSSSYYRAAFGCYSSSYSMQVSCVCVNNNHVPFTCYLFDGPSNCDDIFGKYSAFLTAATVLDALCCFVASCLFFLSITVLCCPTILGKEPDYPADDENNNSVLISSSPVPMRFHPSTFNTYNKLKLPKGSSKGDGAPSDSGSEVDGASQTSNSPPKTPLARGRDDNSMRSAMQRKTPSPGPQQSPEDYTTLNFAGGDEDEDENGRLGLDTSVERQEQGPWEEEPRGADTEELGDTAPLNSGRKESQQRPQNSSPPTANTRSPTQTTSSSGGAGRGRGRGSQGPGHPLQQGGRATQWRSPQQQTQQRQQQQQQQQSGRSFGRHPFEDDDDDEDDQAFAQL